MARQRVDATLGALARRRADISSAHFGIAFQMTESLPDSGEVRARGDRIAVSAPKRQLKLAVDRNALKRVAREAWRLAPWAMSGRPQVILLRLRRAEADWKNMGRATLKKAWRAEIDELLGRLMRRLVASAGESPGASAVPAAVEAPGAGVVETDPRGSPRCP